MQHKQMKRKEEASTAQVISVAGRRWCPNILSGIAAMAEALMFNRLMSHF